MYNPIQSFLIDALEFCMLEYDVTLGFDDAHAHAAGNIQVGKSHALTTKPCKDE